MVTRIQAVTGRKVLGNVAQRAYKAGDENVVGGNPIPVYKVDDSELVENGGQFRVSGNKAQQFLVYEVSGETPLGGSALPIYIINDTPPIPTAPTNLTATPNGLDTIDLAWVDNSSNETGFQIERRLLAGVFALIHTTAANITSYSDGGLTSDTYEYRVRAINAEGNSAYSNTAQATLPPTAPSNLVATANGSDTIDLTWTDNSTNETGFEIERRTLPAGVFALIHTTVADVVIYADTGLSAGSYEYRVRAVNSGGGSAYSNTDQATLIETFNFDPALATFTAAMGKRNGPGPFAAAPIVQGEWFDGNPSDQVVVAAGTQISGNFYPVLDTRQGALIFWITPEWAGTESGNKTLFMDSAARVWLRKINSALYFITAGGVVSINADISGWVAGSTYCVIARWDSINPLDGTNHLCLSINDVHTFGHASTFSQGGPGSLYIGHRTTLDGAANALIEGLTIYRRPLFDGTYGINAGNGDELNLIYNAGSGQDPTLITGSWDVVLCIPTNSTIGALATGTGEAWTHPHASAVLTDSWCQTTYASSAWATRGAPTTGPADMTTAEKIFNWGYEWTASADGDGVTQSKTGQTAGQNYVIRCLAHEDSAADIRIRVHDDTNGADIVTFLFGSGSSKAAPGVAIFTWELPTVARNGVAADCTAMTISVEGTAAAQVVYLHQAEVQVNLIDNPSMETGSGDPWIPDGWLNIAIDAGDTAQELVVVHSGSSSTVFSTTFSVNELLYQTPIVTLNTYAMFGTSLYGDGVASVRILDGISRIAPQYKNSPDFLTPENLATAWKNVYGVGRAIDNAQKRPGYAKGSDPVGNRYADDYYIFILANVTLTITPASLANSTESAGIRVDGRDTFSQPITAITTSQGKIRINYTPRHSAANMLTFGSTPYILDAYGDANDFIRVNWGATNTLQLTYSMNGTTANGVWDATGAIVAGTTYLIEVEYTGGGNMTLSVNGVARITLAGIPAAFGTAPITLYAGHKQDSTLQGDAVFGAPP